MSEEHLTYNDYGAKLPTAEYEPVLPLSIWTGGANILITDANGVEIVPFMPEDFTEEPGVEMILRAVKVLKKFYESPEVLATAEENHLKGRLVYGDNEGEEDIWFEPQALPTEPIADEEAVDKHMPFKVVIDDEADWPKEVAIEPDHEVRIEDGNGSCWYRTETAACDAMYTETPENALTNAAELIENVRLAYEKPGVFIARYQVSET